MRPFRRWFLPARRGKLKRALAEVAAGEAFLLQGGDCAESFAEHSRRQHPRLLPRLPADGGGADLRRRLAGGEGRPHRRPVRQAALRRRREKQDGVELPSYRGDIINGIEFTEESRTPDPQRQIEAYRQSAATLNLLRAFAHGGYANLEQRASVDARLRQGQPAGAPLRGAGRPHHRDAATSCAPAASIRKRIRSCARPTSTPATRRCCSATSRR